jgi:putative ABC transport system permease protein
VVAAIFRRPLAQVALGVGIGFVLVSAAAAYMSRYDPGGRVAPDAGLSAGQVGMLVGYGGFMLAVCLLACVVPTLRALRVQPTEALRAE